MSEFAMDDIGRRLQHARRQRGLSLGDVASLTKLAPPIIQAIERNDFDSLPSGIYRSGYLRSVAAEVGVDPSEVVADYRHQFESGTETAPSHSQSRLAAIALEWRRMSSRLSRWALVAGLIAAAATLVSVQVFDDSQMRAPVIWLTSWAIALVAQAVWSVLHRKPHPVS
jgi:cytoskeletal protein RodZ